MLDELAAEQTKLLEQESVELETQAEKLADEIKELSGEELSRISQERFLVAPGILNAAVGGDPDFPRPTNRPRHFPTIAG